MHRVSPDNRWRDGLAQEERLLLLCARLNLDPPTSAAIQELARRALDWDAFVQLATRHAVLPLVYRSLKAAGADGVPQAAMEALESQYRRNSMKNLLFCCRLADLVARLKAEGIRSVALKGPVLACVIYRNPSYRQFVDLDLLIARTDLEKARRVLADCGYQELPSNDGDDYHITLTRPGEPTVELHWALSRRRFPFDLEFEQVWERGEDLELAGTTLRTMHRDDRLLYLCVHGAKHVWSRVGWVCDVRELVNAWPDERWTAVRARAAALGCRRMFDLGLYLADTLLEQAGPARPWSGPRGDASLPILFSTVLHTMFREGEHRDPVRLRTFHLYLRERLRDRLPYLAYWLPRYLFRPPSSQPNGSPATGLQSVGYRLYRPFRLLGRYALRPLIQPDRREAGAAREAAEEERLVSTPAAPPEKAL